MKERKQKEKKETENKEKILTSKRNIHRNDK